MTDKKQEVAVKTEGITAAQMIELMSISTTVATSDPKKVQEDILNRILAAGSVEDVFANVGSLTHSDAILGREIEVSAVRYNKSDYAEGLGFYAVIDYVDIQTGVQDTASIGSTNAMAQLFRLDTLEALPIKMVLKQSDRPTAQGYYPQFFTPVG